MSGRHKVLVEIGVRQRGLGDFRAAIAALDEAISLADSSTTSLDIARALLELGVAHRYHGDEKQARHHYRRAFELVHPVIGWTTDAKDIFATLCHNLASLEQTCGNLQPAEFWARLAVHIRVKVHGGAHLSVLGDKAILATALRELGKVAEANRMLRKILLEYQRRLGPRHYEVAVVLHNLAACASTLGDERTALGMAKEAVSMKQATLGTDHPDIAVSLANLGHIHESLGDRESASATYRDAVRILQGRVRADHPTLTACVRRIQLRSDD